VTSASFHVTAGSDASAARRYAIDVARTLNFDEVRTGTVALVVTELATNIAKHAPGGEVLVRHTGDADGAVEVLAIDKGPGIADVGRALEDGFSTAGSLGHGLGIVSRQADEFDLYSRLEFGTVVLARVRGQRNRNAPVGRLTVGSVSVALRDEPVCGDDWAIRWRGDQGELLVVDGLGHGVGASEAALAATRAFTATLANSVVAIIEELHLALRHTRGGALAVAAIDLDRQVLKFAGLGNVGASIITPGRKRVNLASQNGTAGHMRRRIQEFSYPFEAGSTLVMFSDGLVTGWDPGAYADLWSYDPSVVAGVLYRDFSRRRDDVTVVVARYLNA
jgi:anti-sigma regulatory factor (Ser/Thr protein kinase)